jgi:hypothetical protein
VRRVQWGDICVEWGQRFGRAAPRPTLVRCEVKREEGAKLGSRFGGTSEGIRELRKGAKTIRGRHESVLWSVGVGKRPSWK